MNTHTGTGTPINYLLSRNCYLKDELIYLYRIIQEELNSGVDTTTSQMLCIYRELIEKYADKLNHVSLKLQRKETGPEKEFFYECEEQEHSILTRFLDDIRIIKNSLLRYLNK